MKKLLVLIFFVNVSFSLVAKENDAQKKHQLSERQRPDFAAINQLLELDEDQAKQLKTLMEQQKAKHQAQREERQEDRKSQHEAHKQQLLNILSQQQLLNIERARLTVFKNNETVILNRYRTGLGSLDDLDTARTSNATIQATLAQYEYNLATARRMLAVLLGRQDQSLTELDQSSSFPDVLLPLANLPKQNLSRRPDLQAAYYTLKASEFEVDVAYKALLPSINLSAALSDSASSATDALFTNPLWSLLGQMTAPLFQGGALRAQVEIEKLASVNAWWLYQESLLNAVQETQNALDNERALTERKKYTSMAIDNAERSVKTIEGQYRQGLANILDLVSVYNSRFDLQSQLIQLQASQLQNRINLGLALGLGVPYEK